MASRNFKTSEELEQERLASLGAIRFKLPTDKILLIYARQSTKGQVFKNRESALSQTQEQLARAIELGWSEEKRLLFIENQAKDGTIKNASGRLRIDEREGLNTVMSYIESGEARAIMARDVARLFRDEDLVGPVGFARACKIHQVFVITDDYLYNFNDPKHGGDDYKKFLAEAQAAADFLEKHIRNVMQRNRDRKGLRGEYIGHTLPIGFMLDNERTFYVPNPYHQEKVKWLFKRFRALGGNITSLRHDVVGKPIFPDLPPEIMEEIRYINLTKVEGGWTIRSYDGLIYILTNPAYIGHVYYNGRIVKKNAHPAIVDENDFWFAYNRLATHDFDGNPIEQPEGRTKRYHQKNQEPDPALFAGLRSDGTPVITTTVSEKAGVYVLKSCGNWIYRINDRAKMTVAIGQAGLKVSVVDALFSERLLYRVGEALECQKKEQLWLIGEKNAQLESTRDIIRQNMVQKLGEVKQQEDGQVVLDPITTLHNSIINTKKIITEKERVSEVATASMDAVDLRNHFESLKRLRRNLEEMEQKLKRLVIIDQDEKESKEKLPRIYNYWHSLDLEEQQRFIRVVTSRVVFDKLATGWFRLKVEWSSLLGGNLIDEAIIWSPQGGDEAWSNEEIALVKRSFTTSSRQWLLEALPKRSWRAIVKKGNEAGLDRVWTHNTSVIPVTFLSMNDWKFIQENKLPIEEIIMKKNAFWR